MIALKKQLSQPITSLLCSMLHVSVSLFPFRIEYVLIYRLHFVEGCGHCVKFKAPFSEVAQRVAKEKIGLLGAVDATVQESLAQKYEIGGFPTLKLFKNGIFNADYDGKRTVEDLYQFMKKQATPNKDEL